MGGWEFLPKFIFVLGLISGVLNAHAREGKNHAGDRDRALFFFFGGDQTDGFFAGFGVFFLFVVGVDEVAGHGVREAVAGVGGWVDGWVCVRGGERVGGWVGGREETDRWMRKEATWFHTSDWKACRYMSWMFLGMACKALRWSSFPCFS